MLSVVASEHSEQSPVTSRDSVVSVVASKDLVLSAVTSNDSAISLVTGNDFVLSVVASKDFVLSVSCAFAGSWRGSVLGVHVPYLSVVVGGRIFSNKQVRHRHMLKVLQ